MHGSSHLHCGGNTPSTSDFPWWLPQFIQSVSNIFSLSKTNHIHTQEVQKGRLIARKDTGSRLMFICLKSLCNKHYYCFKLLLFCNCTKTGLAKADISPRTSFKISAILTSKREKKTCAISRLVDKGSKPRSGLHPYFFASTGWMRGISLSQHGWQYQCCYFLNK